MNAEHGLLLKRVGGNLSVHLRPTETGLEEHRSMTMNAQTQHVTSRYPHPLLPGERIGGSSRISLHYDSAIDELDQIDQTETWSSGVELLRGKELVGFGNATLTYLGDSDTTIGDCTYRVWRIYDFLQIKGHPAIRLEKWYSPDLGVVLKVMSLQSSGHPVSMVEFDEIMIATPQEFKD